MENVLLKDVLILEKEGYSKSDKGEFCMVNLWIGKQPLKYCRANFPKEIYDLLEPMTRVDLIVDYRFFQDKCTGIKVISLG